MAQTVRNFDVTSDSSNVVGLCIFGNVIRKWIAITSLQYLLPYHVDLKHLKESKVMISNVFELF
jgi:hypothetical protein